MGKAGDNGFLRFRLRRALTDRATGGPVAVSVSSGGSIASAEGFAPSAPLVPSAPAAAIAVPDPESGGEDVDAAMIEYYEARAPEYDDWYLRRGRYSHGPIHDAAWNAELDAAGTWLDGLPFSGEIVELAAGTGWWSPLLASRGDLSLYDTSASSWIEPGTGWWRIGSGHTCTFVMRGRSPIVGSMPSSPGSGSATSRASGWGRFCNSPVTG